MKAVMQCCFAVSLLTAVQVASAAPIIIGSAFLSGANEVPSNASTATGYVAVFLDGNLLDVDLSFNGLTGGPAGAAHIHCCTPPGTNTSVAVPFTGFPAVTTGSYTHSFDLTDPTVYTSSFLTASGGTAAGAEAALLSGIGSDRAYVNIHDTVFPGGEIRGFLTPEPASAAMIALGLGALLLRRLRRS